MVNNCVSVIVCGYMVLELMYIRSLDHNSYVITHRAYNPNFGQKMSADSGLQTDQEISNFSGVLIEMGKDPDSNKGRK